MFCSKCGKELGDGVVFCPNCGTQVAGRGEPQAAEPPKVAPSRNRLIGIVTVAIVAVLLIAVVSSLTGSRKGFEIEGSWKSVGSYGFGQAQPGAIVVFNGERCNFFSPSDTYALRREDGDYVLDVTSLLAQTLTFDVEVENKNHIYLTYGGYTTELERMK